ncbi:hypothetical protein, partial [Aminobacter carboxidus]|uniref:hypothetical protein n=1 Tax=Aminobacter carboxidus TaxID=376165 RepID=UPI001AED35AF
GDLGVDLGVDLGDWPTLCAFTCVGELRWWWWRRLTMVVILDLVSERSEWRVSGILCVWLGVD